MSLRSKATFGVLKTDRQKNRIARREMYEAQAKAAKKNAKANMKAARKGR